MTTKPQKKITIKTEILKSISGEDLADLCNITEEAIKAGGGFGWLKTPPREVLNKYWKGLVVVQNRILIVGRLNEAIAGTLQLALQPTNNEAQKKTCSLTTFFLAPWARGHGITPELIKFAENLAKKKNFNVITLDVRETQIRAIEIYEKNGYIKFGVNPFYATVSKKFVKGYYYFKQL